MIERNVITRYQLTDGRYVGHFAGEICGGMCERPPGHAGRHDSFDGPTSSDAVSMHPVPPPRRVDNRGVFLVDRGIVTLVKYMKALASEPRDFSGVDLEVMSGVAYWLLGLAARIDGEATSAISLEAIKSAPIVPAEGVPVTRAPLHQARPEPWSTAELMAQLCVIVDTLAADKDRVVSPLDVALELLGGELEAFVLFGRMGHLNPPREDGKVPIAILQHKSEDPEIDQKIRETAQKWATEQEGQS